MTGNIERDEGTLSEQMNAGADYLREASYHFAQRFDREPTWQELGALLALQHRGTVDRLDEAVKAARLFNRSGMTWLEYDRKLVELEQFVNHARGQ
jgi:hypothetical protein